MTDRERFVNYMLGEPVDRPPFWLFWGPWPSTWKMWRSEGMPPELSGIEHVHELRQALGGDTVPQSIPVNCGPCPKVQETVIEENERWRVFIDNWGIKRRDLKTTMSMSEFLSFPVRSREDWEKYKAERLDPNHPDRLAGDWEDQCVQWMNRGWPIQLGDYPDGIFGTVRWLLGDEDCLTAFYTQPDLVHDIMNHMTMLYLTVFKKVASRVRVDVIHIWEDMCGRQGPLISPRLWEEFMGPCYQRIHAFAREHGIPLISVDTDGNPGLIIPPMMRSGVNFVFPFEVAAGCDVNEYRNRFPSLGMMGGIDKRELAKDHIAIERELDRIRPAFERGRYIPDLDHGVPDDVSWDNFHYYTGRLRSLVMQG